MIATDCEGNAHEEEKPRESVGKSMGKQNFSVPFQGYHLIEALDEDDESSKVSRLFAELVKEQEILKTEDSKPNNVIYRRISKT